MRSKRGPLRRLAGLVFCTLAAGGCTKSTATDAGSAADDAGMDGGSITFFQSALPANETVRGTITRRDTGAPLVGALVTVGAASVATGTDGSFSFPAAPRGKSVVTVSAVGFASHRRDVAIGAGDLVVKVALAPSGPSQAIDAAGGSINSGAATLTFPAGAYSSSTQVSMTAVFGAEVLAVTRRVQYLDAQFKPHRVVAVIHIDAAAQPSIPVPLTVPIPAGLTAMDVRAAYRESDGKLGQVLGLKSSTATTLTFEMPHFSDLEIDINKVSDEASVFPQFADVGVVVEEAAMPAKPVTVGELVSRVASYRVPSGQSVELQDSNGTDYHYVNTTEDEQSFSTKPGFLSGVKIWWAKNVSEPLLNPIGGKMKVASDTPLDAYIATEGATKQVMEGVDVIVNDKKTAFQVEGKPCGVDGPARTIYNFAVYSGEIEVLQKTGPIYVSDGYQIVGCIGCDQAKPPNCCDPELCATGCCEKKVPTKQETWVCHRGDDNQFCGKSAEICGVCAAGFGCSQNACVARTCSITYQSGYAAPCTVNHKCTDDRTYVSTCGSVNPSTMVASCSCTGGLPGGSTSTGKTFTVGQAYQCKHGDVLGARYCP